MGEIGDQPPDSGQFEMDGYARELGWNITAPASEHEPRSQPERLPPDHLLPDYASRRVLHSFINRNGMIRHHIESYNMFINVHVPHIVREYQEIRIFDQKHQRLTVMLMKNPRVERPQMLTPEGQACPVDIETASVCKASYNCRVAVDLVELQYKVRDGEHVEANPTGQPIITSTGKVLRIFTSLNAADGLERPAHMTDPHVEGESGSGSEVEVEPEVEDGDGDGEIFMTRGSKPNHFGDDQWLSWERRHNKEMRGRASARKDIPPATFMQKSPISEYSSSAELDATTVKVDSRFVLVERVFYQDVEMCKVAAMVGSSVCYTSDEPPGPAAPLNRLGGFLIQNGAAKVMMPTLSMRPNRFFVFEECRAAHKTLYLGEIRAEDGSKIRSTRTLKIFVDSSSGVTTARIKTNLLREPIHVLAWLKVLGYRTVAEAARAIAWAGRLADDDIERHPVRPATQRFEMWIASVLGHRELGGKAKTPNFQAMTWSEAAAWVSQFVSNDKPNVRHLVMSEFEPQNGCFFDGRTLRCKRRAMAYYLCRTFRVARGEEPPDDRDSCFALDTPGKRLTHQLRLAHRPRMRALLSGVARMRESNRHVDAPTKFYGAQTTHSLSYAIRTGKWGQGKGGSSITGITHAARRANRVEIISQLTSVHKNAESKKTKNIEPRLLSKELWGLLCPSGTPEGESCGLTLYLSQTAHVVMGSSFEDMYRIIYHHLVVPGALQLVHVGHEPPAWDPDYGATACLFIQGSLVGFVHDGYEACRKIRALRRRGVLPEEVAVSHDCQRQEVFVSCEHGTLRRPLLVLEPEEGFSRGCTAQQRKATVQAQVRRIRQIVDRYARDVRGELYEALRREGLVELVDKDEEANARVRMDPSRDPGDEELRFYDAWPADKDEGFGQPVVAGGKSAGEAEDESGVISESEAVRLVRQARAEGRALEDVPGLRKPIRYEPVTPEDVERVRQELYAHSDAHGPIHTLTPDVEEQVRTRGVVAVARELAFPRAPTRPFHDDVVDRALWAADRHGAHARYYAALRATFVGRSSADAATLYAGICGGVLPPDLRGAALEDVGLAALARAREIALHTTRSLRGTASSDRAACDLDGLLDREVAAVVRIRASLTPGAARRIQDHWATAYARMRRAEQRALLQHGAIPEDMLPALGPHRGRHRDDVTHAELHPTAMLGFVVAENPLPDRNQAPRNTYAQAMRNASHTATTEEASEVQDGATLLSGNLSAAQALGSRTDNDSVVSHGVTAWCAILCTDGSNQEDSLIMRRGFIDSGKLRVMKYDVTRDTATNGIKTDEQHFEKPDIDTTLGLRTGRLDKLQPRGYATPGTMLVGGDYVIGKTTVARSRDGERTKMDTGTIVRMGDPPQVVDSVITSHGHDGYDHMAVRTRHIAIPQVGDKFSTRNGQKGALSKIEDDENMPYAIRMVERRDGKGYRPQEIRFDFIMNTHALPSRMTGSLILEMLLTPLALMQGKVIDATAFQAGTTAEYIQKRLREAGWDTRGRMTLYSGLTGKPFEAQVFCGPVDLMVLKQKVRDKSNVRARGPVTAITRQPVPGRQKLGALKLGEMERDNLLGHGASQLITERFQHSSNPYETTVCSKCGFIALPGQSRSEDAERLGVTVGSTEPFCRNCRSSRHVAMVRTTYSTKQFLQTMMAMGIAPRLNIATSHTVDFSAQTAPGALPLCLDATAHHVPFGIAHAHDMGRDQVCATTTTTTAAAAAAAATTAEPAARSGKRKRIRHGHDELLAEVDDDINDLFSSHT